MGSIAGFASRVFGECLDPAVGDWNIPHRAVIVWETPANPLTPRISSDAWEPCLSKSAVVDVLTFRPTAIAQRLRLEGPRKIVEAMANASADARLRASLKAMGTTSEVLSGSSAACADAAQVFLVVHIGHGHAADPASVHGALEARIEGMHDT
jgi:hypothetical protein